MLRREFLKLAGASALTLIAAPAIARDLPVLEIEDQVALLPMPRPTATRSLFVAHAHSNEHFDGVYWQDGRYIQSALDQINFLMRDRVHGGSISRIDPALLDLLHDLNKVVGTTDPFLFISGYRQPGKGKGKVVDRSHSWHTDGKAIDIRMPTRNLNQVRRTAVAMKRGGVGFYGGGAGHLHLDVGPIRTWG